MTPELFCMGCMREKGLANTCPICHWEKHNPPSTPLQLQPRTVLRGRYLLGVALGQGGFGITYLGWDLTENRKLAVKECFPVAFSTRAADHTTVSPISTNAHQDLQYGLTKFEAEGQALQRFKNHPGVVSILDFFQANGTAYIVMTYLEGKTFKQYLDIHGGRIHFDEALRILSPVMGTLSDVHAVG